MECNCFERIVGIKNQEKISYREIIDKSKAIKDKLVQQRYKNPGPILESLLLARKGLMYKLFGNKTDLINKPNMDHDCHLFESQRTILKELFTKPKPTKRNEPIIIPSSPQCSTPIPTTEYYNMENMVPPSPVPDQLQTTLPISPPRSPAPIIQLELEPERDMDTNQDNQSLALVPYVEPKQMETDTPTTQVETFRQEIEEITKHYYRPKGTTFRVTWAGYDLPPMEEPLKMVLKLGEPALKRYLKTCSKRALTTLLKRHPEVGLITKKSANQPTNQPTN